MMVLGALLVHLEDQSSGKQALGVTGFLFLGYSEAIEVKSQHGICLFPWCLVGEQSPGDSHC